MNAALYLNDFSANFNSFDGNFKRFLKIWVKMCNLVTMGISMYVVLWWLRLILWSRIIVLLNQKALEHMTTKTLRTYTDDNHVLPHFWNLVREINCTLGVESTSTFHMRWIFWIKLFMDHFFTVAPKFHSKFSQKFKNRVFKNFSQKMTKNMLVSGPKNRFWNLMTIQDILTCFKDSKKPIHMEAPKSWGWLNPQCALLVLQLWSRIQLYSF